MEVDTAISEAQAVVDEGITNLKVKVGVDAPRDIELVRRLRKTLGNAEGRQWEAEAQRAPVRSVQLRTGIVLSARGGALEKMLPPFKAFVGGPVGSGRQWFPWIHLADEVAAILWCIDREVTGPVNLAAPGIVTMKEFAKALGRALHRPSWAPVPAAPLRILLGEFASALLEGQRAVPKKLLDSGFRFRFDNVDAALRDLFPER